MTTQDPISTSSFRTTIGQLSQLIPRGRRGRWVLLASFSVFAAAIEAIGALLVFSVLALVQSEESGIGPGLLKLLQGLFPSASESQITIALLAATSTFFLLRSGILIGLTYAQSRIAQSEGLRLSRDLVGGYLSADYEYHLSSDPSVLVRNIIVSVDDATIGFLVPVSRVFSETLATAALVSVLVVSAPFVTLLGAGGIGIATWVVMRIVRPRFHAIGRQNQDLKQGILASLSESFEGIRDVIVTGSRWRYLDEFVSARKDLARARYLRATYETLPRYTVETLLVVGVLVFLAVEVSLEASQESIALIGLFSYAALRTLPAVNQITQAINRIRYAQAAVEDVLADLDTVPNREIIQRQSFEPFPFETSIELNSVTFKHSGSERTILDDVGFTIRAGESVGIVGSTGSGKSTLIDIILGLLAPTRGEVLIDRQNLGEVVPRWHQTIGVVSQTVFLANASLAKNIAFTGSDDSLNVERVIACIRIAQIEQLLDSLPEGMDTIIGGTGTRFSGGERQRVAVARALYRRPDVLLLDEATSALDSATESALIEAIRVDDPDRTVITVTHRLHTLLNCDMIVVLEDGRVSGIGTYSQMLATNATFRKMARSGEEPN